jgi:hypothetical protein
MPLIDRDPAIAALQPHLGAIYNILHGGVADLHVLPLEARRCLTPTTRAGMVHDYQIERATKYFSKFDDVRVHELNKLFVFDVSQRVALRFKKLDTAFRSSNLSTTQVREFRGQVQLGGVDAPSNLEAGYVLCPLEREVVWVGIVCPNNEGTYWQVELKDSKTINTVTDIFDNSDPTEEGTTFKVKKAPGLVIPINRDANVQ